MFMTQHVIKLEAVPCPLCASSDYGPAFVRTDRGQVVRCLNCGLLFLNPRPNEAAIRAFYNGSYFEGDCEGYGYRDYLAQEDVALAVGSH